MTKRTFTADDNGEKFEETYEDQTSPIIIKPIKTVEDLGASEQPQFGNKPAIKQVANLHPQIDKIIWRAMNKLIDEYVNARPNDVSSLISISARKAATKVTDLVKKDEV